MTGISSSANSLRVFLEKTVPVGFIGELIKIALVRFVIDALTLPMSSSKPSSNFKGIRIGSAPLNWIMFS